MKQQIAGNKLYVISGIEPAKKGAGKFLSYFVEILQRYNDNIEVSFIKTPENYLTKILKRNRIAKPLKELYYFFKRTVTLEAGIKNSIIFLFHPQSLGLKKTTKLIQDNKIIYFYVLDNFFFCKKSYNHLLGSNSPCTLCIRNTDEAILNNCSIFPNNYSHNEYTGFLSQIEKNLSKIVFLTQNVNQGTLLKKKFGDNISINKIGMFTGEFEISQMNTRVYSYKYDFLYHNTLSEAKGLRYFAEISEYLPAYKFVIPYTKQQVESIVGKIKTKNILFMPCTWDNGLLDVLLQTRITIVPSLWSAPIEGALLKSIFYSNLVAIIPQKYSFNKEIPEECYLKLESEPKVAAESLNNAIEKGVSLNSEALEWLKEFMDENISSLNRFSKSFSR